MSIEQINPQQAKAILDEDPAAVYVDVRSIPEFIQGHPIRALNIPLFHFDSNRGQLVPNPDFQTVAQKVLPKDKKLLVGCKMGGRSQRACEVFQQLGYTQVYNVDGGFGGHSEQPGWQTLGLPISTENGEGVGYESLLTKGTPEDK